MPHKGILHQINENIEVNNIVPLPHHDFNEDDIAALWMNNSIAIDPIEENPKPIYQSLQSLGRRSAVLPMQDMQEQLKKIEEESNLIRIDLDKAATELAKLQLGIKEGEDTEMYLDYLEVYDKYYSILFNSKA